MTDQQKGLLLIQLLTSISMLGAIWWLCERMKPGATHSTFHRGKRVRMILRSGEHFVAKFVSATRDRLVFDDRTVKKSSVRSATIER